MCEQDQRKDGGAGGLCAILLIFDFDCSFFDLSVTLTKALLPKIRFLVVLMRFDAKLVSK